MNRGRWLLPAVLVLSACGGSVDAPAPTEPPTPVPTPKPWSLAVVGATYSGESRIGGTIAVEVRITNSGARPNPATKLNFSELDKYADIDACEPKCEFEDLPGLGPSAIFQGVPSGKTATYRVEFIATDVGSVSWSVCVSDEARFADMYECYDGRTTIR